MNVYTHINKGSCGCRYEVATISRLLARDTGINPYIGVYSYIHIRALLGVHSALFYDSGTQSYIHMIAAAFILIFRRALVGVDSAFLSVCRVLRVC